MKSYVFPIVLEPDEDVWRAYVPELEARDAATWGHTKEEALRNIQKVAPNEHGGASGGWGTLAPLRDRIRPTGGCGHSMSPDYSRLRSLTAR